MDTFSSHTHGVTSNGSDDEVGSGASVRSVSSDSQTSSASRIWISTCGKDESENPSRGVTLDPGEADTASLTKS